MTKSNQFHAIVECPFCRAEARMMFEADIGQLEYEDFEIGDVVIKSVPLVAKRGKHPVPIGPAPDVDWERPFWAVGFSDCPSCRRPVVARVDVRDRRFAAVRPTLDDLDIFAWGPLDDAPVP